jgi:solute carrier family 38 (sodium-coupled neutral amino acid transporter), member 2
MSSSEEHEGEPLLPSYDQPHSITREFETNTLWAGGTNLLKALLGVGVLVIPRLTAQLGIAPTIVIMVILSLLSWASLHLISSGMADTGYSSLSLMVKHRLGLIGETVVELALALFAFGLMVLSLIVIGDILTGTDGLLSHQAGDRATVLGVFSLFVLTPLTSVSGGSLQSFVALAGIGIYAMLFWVVATALLWVISLTNRKGHALHWWPAPELLNGEWYVKTVQVLATVPAFIIAYGAQVAMPQTLRDLPFVRVSRMSGVTLGAVAVATSAFLVLGVSSVGLFGSENVCADIVNNFTVDALTPLLPKILAQGMFVAVRLGFLLGLLGTFPQLMAPFREASWMLIFRQELMGPGLLIVNFVALAAVYTVAVTSKTLFEPLVLLGSTAGVIVALIVPGLLELANWRYAGGLTRLIATVLVMFGVVIGVCGVVRVIFLPGPLGDD